MSEFKLPDIGEGIVECEVVEWHVAVGDRIEEDQPVVEVMTDKALVEITAPEAGRVTALHVAKGEVARVHAPLFAYQVEAEASEASGRGQTEDDEPPTVVDPPASSAAPTPTAATPVGPDAEAPATGRGPYGRVPAAPAVRRLIREHGLSLEAVPGSGKEGRVLKEDVQDYLERAGGGAQGGGRIEPLRGVRAVMARRMADAAATIPHFHFGEEIDVTELLALRDRLKPAVEAAGFRLTLMPFFMKALALAVREVPIVNSRLNEAADAIQFLEAVNVGMAVDGPGGLVVPSVKGVEQRTLLALAGEVQRLTDLARGERLTREDLKGATVSLSNIGALGGTYAAPIINPPEVCIVAVGRSRWLPRFDADGQVVRRAILTVTWAGDHRVLDGGSIARACDAWKGYLQAPETMLLHLG